MSLFYEKANIEVSAKTKDPPNKKNKEKKAEGREVYPN